MFFIPLILLPEYFRELFNKIFNKNRIIHKYEFEKKLSIITSEDVI